jgi:hypothetical protein
MSTFDDDFWGPVICILAVCVLVFVTVDTTSCINQTFDRKGCKVVCEQRALISCYVENDLYVATCKEGEEYKVLTKKVK